MIKIAATQLVHLKFTEINQLPLQEDKKGYVWDHASFFVADTRLRNIELRLTFFEEFILPPTIQIYYFQQISSSQVKPVSLIGVRQNTLTVRVEESDFWKTNPLIVDKIGFYSQLIKSDFKFKVDAFKFL